MRAYTGVACSTVATTPANTMDTAAIIQYITETFPGVDVPTNAGDSFFIYDPERNLPDNLRWPFATLVTADNWDQFSNLARPGVFRLNIGVGKATYQRLFGAGADESSAKGADAAKATHDFTALDRLMPHPVYGRQHWVCILNPSNATFEKTVGPLLAEAYELVVSRAGKRGGGT
jgi:hypothetical protein